MKFYNTLTKTKEEFIPQIPGQVKMYVCGPTVYNYFHIGNARPFVLFESLRRYLEYKGFKVDFVQNFTDVDDKIIAKSNEEKISPSEVSEKYIAEYFKDAGALGVKPATFHPKVTDTMDEIIEFIGQLVDKGFAYESEGDVYFETMKFKGYGKLSGQSIEDLEAGSRVDVSEKKRHPSDFALWKKKKDGEPFWSSRFSDGRPGWHIECSVMSKKILGETLDIHAGGQDLTFPHHENEIAQSEALSGKQYVKYWLHNGYININNEKMSKSKNNFFTVRDILKSYDGEVIRLFLLSAHYRNPVNFSELLMEQSKSALDRLYNAKDNLEFILSGKSTGSGDDEELVSKEDAHVIESLDAHKKKFIESLDDDFNTADGIASIFELVKDLNTKVSDQSSYSVVRHGLDLLMELSSVLGFLSKKKESIDEDVELLIKQRQEARKNKDYALSDKIRDELKSKSIVLEDTPAGVKWRYEN